MRPLFLRTEEMGDGLLALLARVRSEIVASRGKLSDIRNEYHWDDRIDVAEHGLTLVIAYMFHVIQEIEKVHRLSAIGELDQPETKP